MRARAAAAITGVSFSMSENGAGLIERARRVDQNSVRDFKLSLRTNVVRVVAGT